MLYRIIASILLLIVVGFLFFIKSSDNTTNGNEGMLVAPASQEAPSSNKNFNF